MSMGAVGSGKVVVSDSELISTSTQHITVCGPGEASDLPRLFAHAKMYERYRFLSLRVDYVPTSGAATNGSITITIQPGVKNTKITSAEMAMKCQPCLVRPAWKAGTLRAGPMLDAQRFLHVGVADADGVAFCIYTFPSTPDIGYVKVTYTVEFAFPHPF